MITITNGTATVHPVLVLGYTSRQDAGNIFHKIIGQAAPAVSLRPAALRSGSLSFLFETAADAAAARTLLAQPTTFTYTDTDVPTENMTFALDGTLSRTLEDQTRRLWIVEAGYREVAA